MRKPVLAKPEVIASELERDIRSGRVRYGDRLQSENELVQRFSVSRTTVRKGLEELTARGLITTRVGIGSFVTFRGRAIDDALGWSRALADAGAAAETRILAIARVDDAALAAELGLAASGFIAVDRCRTLQGEGRAISIERARLPRAPDLDDLPETGLVDGSLTATLRARGRVAAGGEEWADLALLGDGDAALFDRPPGTAVLRTRRLTRDAAGRPIEYVTSLLDPAVFALHLEF